MAEELEDRIENGFGVSYPRPVVFSGHLDITSVRDAAGHVAAVGRVNPLLVAAMHYECGCFDFRQEVAYGDGGEAVEDRLGPGGADC